MVRLGAALAVAALNAYEAQASRMVGSGAHAGVALPLGLTGVLLAEDGSRAVATSVTFNGQRGIPERVVTVVAVAAGPVTPLWHAW